MRIVHISDCFSPRVGGIESQVGDLAATQAAAGDQVHVFTATAGSSYQGTEDYRGVAVHRMATRVMLGVPHNPFVAGQMSRKLREIAPDVIHVHLGVVSPFACDGLRRVRAMKLPAVATWHCFPTGPLEGLVVRSSAGLRGWRRAKVVLSAVSQASAGAIAAQAGCEVQVLPNCLDVADWQIERDLQAHEPVRIIATQRLARRKRGVEMVKILSQLADQVGVAAFTVTIAGDGPQRRSMERLAQARGLQFSFTGTVKRQQLRQLYAAHDVFLSATELEAFGIAALEARIAGLAIAGRSGNGLSDFVDCASGRGAFGESAAGDLGSGSNDAGGGMLVATDAALVGTLAAWVRQPDLVTSMIGHNVANPPPLDWADGYVRTLALYQQAAAL